MALDRKVQGVSLDPKTLKEAKDRAEELKISFSAYVYHLIRNDLATRGPIMIKAPPETSAKDK